MTLRLDRHFGAPGHRATVRVVYLDGHAGGSWALHYAGARVAAVTTQGSGSWREAEANITLAPGASMTLSSPSGYDAVFSLLEVLL